jgi:zinc transport system permease protein
VLESVLLFRDALYGALLIALTCSVLGVYVVLRRIVFVGAALAELSSAGIALALWLSGMGLAAGLATHPIALSLIVTLAGVVFFAEGGTRTSVPQDATIGVTYAVAAALGILLVAKARVGEAHDIFLQGNILGITRADTLVLLAVSVPVLLAHALFYKEFLFVSFDRETARTVGSPTRARANSVRCICPPESADSGRSARSRMPTWASASIAIRRSAAPGRRHRPMRS